MTNNHDDQRETYPTMLDELSCTFGVKKFFTFSLLWPSWSWFVAIVVCGRHGHGLWPSWFVAVMV